MSQREDFEEAASRLGYNLTMHDMEYEDGEYLYPVTRGAWDMWQECCAKSGQAVYVVLAPQEGSPDEVFVEIESEDGQSLAVASQVAAGYRRIGPLYTQPQSAQPEFDTGITVSEIEQKAEPVAWLWVKNGLRSPVSKDFADELIEDGEDVQYLYAQPQSAVVPDVYINWSNHRQSNDEIRYDHVIGEAPFGRFEITWKSWKEDDCPTVDQTPWGGFLGAYCDVEEAKSACETEYKRRIEQSFKQLKEQES